MHPAKLFTVKMAQPGYIIGTLTSFSSLSEWYSKGVKFSATLENIDESQRVLAAECPSDHKKPRAHKTSPATRKNLLERQSLCYLKKKKIKNQWFSRAFPPNSFRCFGSLSPNVHDIRAAALTQRLFFYSWYSGIAKMFSLPFCDRLEVLPACLGMPWWCFDHPEKIFPTSQGTRWTWEFEPALPDHGSTFGAWVQMSLSLWADCTPTSERQQGHTQRAKI